MRLAELVVDRKDNQLMSARSIYEIPDEKLTPFGNPANIGELKWLKLLIYQVLIWLSHSKLKKIL